MAFCDVYVVGMRKEYFVDFGPINSAFDEEEITNTTTSGKYSWEDVADVDFGIGRIDDSWSSEFGPGFIVNDIKLSDLGKLGEGIVNYYDDREAGIGEDTFVTMSFDILPMMDRYEG